MSIAFKLNCRGKIIDLNSHTHLMGVINCTPDSFYAGSRNFDAKSAIELGIRMAEEGADILDIGGESTRPGAESVSEQEELNRIVPVISALLSVVDVPLSIDTYKAKVAQEALELGAHMLNDISALTFDPGMAAIVSEFNVPVILMHIKGKPKDMQKHPYYDDVIDEIFNYFEQRIQYALKCGIKFEQIILDPGIGFGKRLVDNYDIIKNLSIFKKLERPILVGISRKSFIGKVLNLPPEESMEGSIAASTAAILNGANILRVHDVKEMKRAAKITDTLTGKSLLCN
ncbi:MAG: dihydropteroate synthase [bacterium]